MENNDKTTTQILKETEIAFHIETFQGLSMRAAACDLTLIAKGGNFQVYALNNKDPLLHIDSLRDISLFLDGYERGYLRESKND